MVPVITLIVVQDSKAVDVEIIRLTLCWRITVFYHDHDADLAELLSRKSEKEINHFRDIECENIFMNLRTVVMYSVFQFVAILTPFEWNTYIDREIQSFTRFLFCFVFVLFCFCFY